MGFKLNITKPQNPVAGDVYFDVNQGIVKLYTGTGWVATSFDDHMQNTDPWAWQREGMSLTATSHCHELFTDTYMNTIQDWSAECHCGLRISFDTWRFDTEADITAFLIRWS